MQSFKYDDKPLPVNSLRSMIPFKMRGKRVTTEFPLFSCDRESVRRALVTHEKYLYLRDRYSICPKLFQPLNFFEYILKCRFEHELDLKDRN